MDRILIAEDRESSRELMKTVLEASGFEVIEAANGKEAVEQAESGDVQLFLLDLQMPEIDGFGVLARIRRMERYRTTPVLAVTASAMHGDRERALQAGFTAYVPKPVDMSALRSTIRSLLQK